MQIGIIGRNQAVEDVAYVLFSVFNVIWATVYLETCRAQAFIHGKLINVYTSSLFKSSHPSFIEFHSNLLFISLSLFLYFFLSFSLSLKFI